MNTWFTIVKCPFCGMERTVELTKKKWKCPLYNIYHGVRETKRKKEGADNG